MARSHVIIGLMFRILVSEVSCVLVILFTSLWFAWASARCNLFPLWLSVSVFVLDGLFMENTVLKCTVWFSALVLWTLLLSSRENSGVTEDFVWPEWQWQSSVRFRNMCLGRDSVVRPVCAMPLK